MNEMKAKLSDGVWAGVDKINLTHHYSGVLEAVPGGISRAQNCFEIPRIHERIARIHHYEIKGRYCLEPVLMDEEDLYLCQSRRYSAGPRRVYSGQLL